MIEIMEKQIKKNKYFISYYDSLKQMNKIIDHLSKFLLITSKYRFILVYIKFYN
jgi:cytochrome oxidase Cu insertion factor (SCO1/SenC/PrrC family)